MHIKLSRFVDWKDRLIIDWLMACVEASVVLLITNLYLIALSINYGLNKEGIDIWDAFYQTITTSLRITDMITYVAGVLSSTTAYFIIRLGRRKQHIGTIAIILFSTAVIFFIATPLFFSGLENGPANKEFAADLVIIVVISALVILIFSLYSKRRIFEKGIRISGDSPGKKIAIKLGGSNGEI